jgi:DegV family protein with EDD domain
MKEIDAAKFKEILKRGMEHLFQDRDLLNRINVFPVPDGDTGDNLVNTLKPVYEEMDAMAEPRLDDLADRLARRMLMSAKGNSGVIFSQFFFGFAKALKGLATIGPADFSLAMEKAVRDTYKAVADPREGTILTVLRHTAEEFKRLALNGERYQVIFEKAIIKAKEILERTRDLLPQLKKARVVDAGGMGFYLFFKGMAAAVLGHASDGPGGDPRAFDQEPRHTDASELAYCAEWVVRPHPHGADRETFREMLARHGDSLLIAGDTELFHLHLHTDDPDAAEGEIRRHAEVVSRKVDPLRRGTPAVSGLPVAVLMDSAVDIPGQTESEWGISFVPLQVLLDKRFFHDRIDVSREELYRRMRGESKLIVKTSQPSPYDYTTAYEAALARKPQVLLFSISSRLSGSHQNAVAAAHVFSEADQARIRVVDTRNVSAGSGLLLCRALRFLRQGRNMEEAAAAVERLRDEVVSLGYVESLKYAVRGGRLPPFAGFVAGLLRAKPLVAFEGGLLVRKGALFSARRRERKLVRRFLKRLDLARPHALAIAYTDNPQVVKVLEDELARSPLKMTSIYAVAAAAVLGAHAGPGTFCLWALPDD